MYYQDDVLKDSMVPGYPKATGDKALGIWCALLSGTDAAVEQSAEEVDEKIFTLRPYVFACAKVGAAATEGLFRLTDCTGSTR